VIPADKVKRIVTELTQFGKVRPAWLGFDVQPLTLELSRRLGWDRTFGAVITNVEESRPAAEAGLQRGDIVTQVATTQVEDADDLKSRFRSFVAKTPVPLRVFRGGQVLEVSVTPVEFPARLVDATVWDRLGLRVKAGQGGMPITSVRPGTAAARVGLEPGDVILKVNNAPVGTPELFREAIIHARGKPSVLLLVRRGQRGYYLTLPF
jgi:serine protease Do